MSFSTSRPHSEISREAIDGVYHFTDIFTKKETISTVSFTTFRGYLSPKKSGYHSYFQY